MILLIQFRTDRSGPHEIKCLHRVSGLSFNAFKILNAQADDIRASDLKTSARKAEAVILGGLGEGGYETRGKTMLKKIQTRLEPTVNFLLRTDKPTLAICFGHQLIADIAGGKITAPPEQAETGIAKLTLTEHGARDDIFSKLPQDFNAVVSHKASVTKTPESAVNLAKGEHSPFQAFRYKNNIYTCQFHMELDVNDMFERMQIYPEYLENEINYDRNAPLDADKISRYFFQNYTSEQVIDN